MEECSLLSFADTWYSIYITVQKECKQILLSFCYCSTENLLIFQAEFCDFFAQDFEQILENCMKIWVHPLKLENVRMIFQSDFAWTEIKFLIANRQFLILKFDDLLYDDTQFANLLAHVAIGFTSVGTFPKRKMCGFRKYPSPQMEGLWKFRGEGAAKRQHF